MIAGAAVTGYSSYQANKTAKKAVKTETDFAQQQYEDWQAIYGPIQENLSSYYQSLNPEMFAAMGIENLEQEYSTQLERMNQNFAQRGIDTSGISADLERQNAYDLARAKATVRRDAPMQVAQMQQGFLQVGMGRDPTSQMANTLGRQTQYAQQQSSYANQAFGSSVGNLVNYGINQYGANSGTTGLDANTMAGSPNIDYSVGIA